jgi:hypothetical protein
MTADAIDTPSNCARRSATAAVVPSAPESVGVVGGGGGWCGGDRIDNMPADLAAEKALLPRPSTGCTLGAEAVPKTKCCSVGFARVEVESSVGALVECLLEGGPGGEADRGRRLINHRCINVATDSELGRDAAAGKHGVPGGLR